MGSIISNLAMPNRISSRYFKTSPEIIEFAFMPYVRCPLSLRLPLKGALGFFFRTSKYIIAYTRKYKNKVHVS